MTVRFRPWASIDSCVRSPSGNARLAKRALSALVLLAGLSFGGDGVRLQDHWYGLGLSAQDVELIDKLDLSKKEVERLVLHGVSVREYARRPWEAMGITESQWTSQLDNGNDIGALERRYDRSRDVEEHEGPSLVAAFFLPGYVQIREERPAMGWILAGLGSGFAIMTVKSLAEKESSLTWPILLGGTMTFSLADVWWNHSSEQARTGFAWAVLPGEDGATFVLAGKF